MSARLLTFRVGARLYGVEVAEVAEVLAALPLTRVPRSPASLAGLVNLRGQVVTVVDLRARLGLPPADVGADEKVVVVLRAPTEPTALLVDAVGSVVDVDAPVPAPDTLSGDSLALVDGVHPLPADLLLRLDVAQAVAV